jgi:hypothetical protein
LDDGWGEDGAFDDALEPDGETANGEPALSSASRAPGLELRASGDGDGADGFGGTSKEIVGRAAAVAGSLVDTPTTVPKPKADEVVGREAAAAPQIDPDGVGCGTGATANADDTAPVLGTARLENAANGLGFGSVTGDGAGADTAGTNGAAVADSANGLNGLEVPSCALEVTIMADVGREGSAGLGRRQASGGAGMIERGRRSASGVTADPADCDRETTVAAFRGARGTTTRPGATPSAGASDFTMTSRTRAGALDSIHLSERRAGSFESGTTKFDLPNTTARDGSLPTGSPWWRLNASASSSSSKHSTRTSSSKGYSPLIVRFIVFSAWIRTSTKYLPMKEER